MDNILFEKQEARLCAQHALNMLLQGAYFTAGDLADIALELDNAERAAGMLDIDVGHNVDDTGFFSVQVISAALNRAMNLTMTSLTHPDVFTYRENPTLARGYICNLNQHWFAVRRFGARWFELNSIKSGPVPITDSHLNEFFAQLLQEGYSIFLVDGDFPDSPADRYFSSAAEAGEILRQPVNVISAPQGRGADAMVLDEEEDPELRAALEASRAQFDDEDVSLARALEASRLNAAAQTEAEDRALQEALRASQDAFSADYEHDLREAIKQSIHETTEEEDLRLAMEMSIKDATQRFEQDTATLLASTSQAGPSGISYPRNPVLHSSDSASGSSKASAPSPSSANARPMPATADDNAERLRRQRAAFLDRLKNNPSAEQK
uniref:ubiquitinyl hydrolase 1 n=1 Tax=Steinernema glaseri TaxID=37863 RepID=A0A1I7Y1T5_9BILA